MLAPYDLTTQKLLMILHRSLVEARTLARAGDCQRLQDLADCFEELPALMLHCRDDAPEAVQARLVGYQAKYPTASEYLLIWEMNEDDFQAVFGGSIVEQVGVGVNGGQNH